MLRKINFRKSHGVKNLALSVLSAILLILAFPPFNIWLMAWIAFVPLFISIEHQSLKKSFLLSYITGVLFFLGTIYWLSHVSLPGMLIVVMYLALYFGLFGVIINITQYAVRNTQYVSLFLIPSIWVALEWARSHVFTGFGWALLGYSQSFNLPAIQISDITGAYGVSFFIMMLNALIFFVIKNIRNKKELFVPVAVITIVTILVFGYGILRLGNIFTGEKLKVSVVQGSIPQYQKWDERFVENIIKKYQSLTILSSRAKPDIIIWPETSIPGFVENEKVLSDWMKGLTVASDTPILAGAPRYENVNGRELYYNSAFLFLKNGNIAGHYDKIHLVPFGEYVPLQKLFFFVHRFAPRPIGDFVGGEDFTILRFPIERSIKNEEENWKLVKKVGIGCLICFEDIFPELARGFARNNASVLVNITNDAWFGMSSATYQHAQALIFRAVENRINAIRSANTGLSCFINQKGQIVSKVSKDGKDIFVDGIATCDITLSRARTIYTVYGDVFAYLCIFLTAFYIAMSYRYRRVAR